MDKKKTWDNIQDGTAIALSVASTTLGPTAPLGIGVASIGVRIVNRVLVNTKLLEDDSNSISEIADEQLNEAINKAIQYTVNHIDAHVAQKLALYLEQRINGHFTVNDDAYMDLVYKAVSDMDRYEEYYVDKKTILCISEMFLNRLKEEFVNPEHQILFNVLIDKRVATLESIIAEMNKPMADSKEFELTKYYNFYTKPYFTGREEEIRNLKERIAGPVSHISLHGIGGIGKTEILKKIYQHYITCSSEHISTGIERIAYFIYKGSMDITVIEQLKHSLPDSNADKISFAWESLEEVCSKKKTLILVDNVDKTPDEDSSLCKLNRLNATVIISTRVRNYPEFEHIEIREMGYEENRKIFTEILRKSGIYISEEEEPVLNNMITKLIKNHTAATIFIANTVADCGYRIPEIFDLLTKFGFNIPEEAENTDISKEISKLFPVTHLSDKEKNLLAAFSLMPNIPIEQSKCEKWFLQDAGAEKIKNIFSQLNRKGWLERSGFQYLMHPIIGAAVRYNEKISDRDHVNLLQNLINELAWDEASPLDQKDHSLVCAMSIFSYFDTLTVVIPLGYYIGTILDAYGDYENALFYVSAAFEGLKKVKELNPEYPVISTMDTMIFLMSSCLICLGRPKEVFNLIENSYSLISESNRISINNNIAIMLSREALKTVPPDSSILEIAIDLIKIDIRAAEAKGTESEHLINALSTYVKLLILQGRVKETGSVIKRIFILREKLFPENHIKIGFGYAQMGLYFFVREQYELALQAYIYAIKVFSFSVPSNHELIRNTKNNITACLDKQMIPEEKFEEMCSKPVNSKELLEQIADD